MAARAHAVLFRLGAELGVPTIYHSPRDTKLLCLQRFTRLLAYGASTLILVLYLSSLGVSETRIGLFMTLTLLGDVVISFFLTLFADGLGRRKILVVGAGLMAMSGVVFAVSGNYWVLVAASIFGVISPSGNEIGPFKAIEESTLAQLTPKDQRPQILAWYNLIGMGGVALGTLSSGWLVALLQGLDGWTPLLSYRVIFGIYSFLGVIKLILSLLLSSACEPSPPKPVAEAVELQEAEGLLHEEENPNDLVEPPTPKLPPPYVRRRTLRSFLPAISPASRSILLTLCLLFMFDSLASGLIPNSWMIYFFTSKFSLQESTLGTLFFCTSLVASLSNLLAASIAARIGLIRTMVFTHLPSAICLTLIPLPSSPILAMALLILRSSTASMDQAPRQAFIAAAVLPSERTAVMGVVNVVKTLSQSAGPTVTGWLAGLGKFWIAFLVAGSLKIGYDLGMLKVFIGFKGRDDEEDARVGRPEEADEVHGREGSGEIEREDGGDQGTAER